MNHNEEGYIKFACHWTEAPALIPESVFDEVNAARHRMLEKGLIGCYDNGIGFGNISIRNPEVPEQFFITGSATGHIKEGAPAIYALAERWDIARNTLWCKGPLRASSESMSHAIIYDTCPEVQCVIHIHSMELWKKAIREIPCTPGHVSYGTPEMALAIRDLILFGKMQDHGILAMKGHEEGIVMFGRSATEAERQINI
ncbi:MAG TPA: class II aldolase/adducin family protein [Bacteroidales bacterium]|nr:class II aldolase/adducin family protein [Bacteroidales bacterium]HRZ49216.1 class II aldolase/adducin family protein [Bacteroidales bacterium]